MAASGASPLSIRAHAREVVRRFRAVSRQVFRCALGRGLPAELPGERGRGPRLRMLGCHASLGGLACLPV
eukprot:14814894-Alexandrium_andersonii.AAC.1